MQPLIVYVGLGSNLGDRRQNIGSAIELLGKTPGLQVLRAATILENAAVGGPENSPVFLNTVVEIKTSLSAHALLNRLMQIESELGRVRRDKWEPRIIDADLLLYGNHIFSSQDLIVPHPLMHERRFVLQPLAELAPDVVHPVLQMSIRGLLDNLVK